MEEPVVPRSPEPSEEAERLRDQLRRLEARQAEVEQKLFDQYEWTREQTKAFAKELGSIRKISIEYQVLEFLHGLLQRTTGLPGKTLQEEVKPVKVSLVAIPAKADPNAGDWFNSLLRQTHDNLELIIVLGESAPEISQDIKGLANVREVRVDDNYSDAIRADIGLSYASGKIRGFVLSGYWPYERTVENVARFFCEHRACQVVAPLDFSMIDGLIAPTGTPGRRDFTEIWKSDFTGLGSLFFRPEAYQKLGRSIVSDTGDAWIYATLLYLSSYHSVGTPCSLVFVNGAIQNPEPEAQAKKESAYRELKQRFYLRSPFREFKKAVWYCPISPLTHRGHRVRTIVEQALLWIRCFGFWPIVSVLSRVRRMVFSRVAPLLFPVPVANPPVEATKVELYPVEPCPLTERCPDRFLFSLRPEGGSRIADVFYDSASSIAILNRSRIDGGSSNATTVDPGLASGSVKPADTVSSEAGSGGQRDPRENDVSGLAVTYEAVVASLIEGTEVTSAVLIGDRRFIRNGFDRPGYEKAIAWDEIPALEIVDFMALHGLDLLSGRNPEMGTGLDLIHLAGVLQFCRRPRHLLRFLAMSLRYDRYLLVSTPNLDSISLQRCGPAWPHWEPNRTWFVYGANALRALMKHCGFEEKKLISFSPASGEPIQRKPDGDFLAGLYGRKL